MSREGRLNDPVVLILGQGRASSWVGLLLGALLASFPALAQTSGDNGIKVGEGRLHPYFDLEGDYDSAAGFFATNAANTTASLSGEIVTHFRPGFRLELPTSFVNLNLGGDLDYVYYTGLISPGSTAASHFEGAANLETDFNKTGAVEFEFGDNFSRLDRTTNVAIGVGILSLYNETHASLPIHPGGGALEITPHGSVAFEQYTPLSTLTVQGCTLPNDPACTPSLVSNFNYVNFLGGLTGLWRFLPKTAISLEATYSAQNYQSDPHPAELFHAQLGLVGLITAKLAVVAKAGWAQDFSGTGARTVVGHAELNYLLSDTSNLKAGYMRDLAPVPDYGIYGDDRVYAEARFFLGGRLTLRAYGAFDNLSFYGTQSRTDQLVTVDGGPQYQFTRWLVVAGGYTLNYRTSNLTAAQNVNYTRNVGYLRVEFTY